MLVLVPPSEGKSAPRRGKPLDLSALSAPDLTPRRAAVLDALVDLCTADPDKAADVLGLGPTQAHEVERNRRLTAAPAAAAATVYSGVLFSALDPTTITGAPRRRLNRWVRVQSALFGLVRLTDRIPAYRLSGDAHLPGIGAVARHWRDAMAAAVPAAAGEGLVVDMRSTAYTAFWRGDGRTVALRVLQEVDGRRTVVSHSNKATKGHLLRAMVDDGGVPRSAPELVDHLGGLGWRSELSAVRRVDVVVTDL